MVLDDTTQGVKSKQGALLLWHTEVQEGSSYGAQTQGLELRVQQSLGQIWVDKMVLVTSSCSEHPFSQ